MQPATTIRPSVTMHSWAIRLVRLTSQWALKPVGISPLAITISILPTEVLRARPTQSVSALEQSTPTPLSFGLVGQRFQQEYQLSWTPMVILARALPRRVSRTRSNRLIRHAKRF